MNNKDYGPKTDMAEWVDKEKYREEGETFDEKCVRIAKALTDDPDDYRIVLDLLRTQAWLPAGRSQASVGALRSTTAYNCFVMPDVPDSMDGIMDVLKQAALTMKMGGGVGYNFSLLRPKGELIKSLDSSSSGPLSFMNIYDAMCGTICSAGHRRGAQMGCLRVDHPDIREFIHAKANTDQYTNFNLSVLVTDPFMEAVKNDALFDLVFDGKVYETVRARELWNEIMTMTWDWAEPGVLFIDRINDMNNLKYAEEISATNPCAEQPLPPFGACLLGSLNLTKFCEGGEFHMDRMLNAIPYVVRATDNIIDETIYPLRAQEMEAKNKRRMGLGITGLANVLSYIGLDYGSPEALEWTDKLMRAFTNACYLASSQIAREKGSFPYFHSEKYSEGKFFQQLEPEVQRHIMQHGLRNSHLTSIAPTGSISLAANNVSSGIEPVFAHSFTRTYIDKVGPQTELVEDYGVAEWGIYAKQTAEVTVNEHVDMLTTVQKWVDSSVSKTCNIGDDVTFDDFKEVYLRAYDGGAKGCTTFRAAGKRSGILQAPEQESDESIIDGTACYIDSETGMKSCE